MIDLRKRFGNFYVQAEMAEITVRQSFRAMLGLKLDREKNVFNRGKASNEPRIETVLDIAGYAILWYAHDLAELEQLPDGKDPVQHAIDKLSALLVKKGEDYSATPKVEVTSAPAADEWMRPGLDLEPFAKSKKYLER